MNTVYDVENMHIILINNYRFHKSEMIALDFICIYHLSNTGLSETPNNRR